LITCQKISSAGGGAEAAEEEGKTRLKQTFIASPRRDQVHLEPLARRSSSSRLRTFSCFIVSEFHVYLSPPIPDLPTILLAQQT
jgi:hypothetical protein